MRTPAWELAEPGLEDAFTELLAFLGEDTAHEFPMPGLLEHVLDLHRTICDADIAVSLAPEYDKGKAKLSRALRTTIEGGRKVLAGDYIRAVEPPAASSGALDDVFERYDAILTPATTGEAPQGT